MTASKKEAPTAEDENAAAIEMFLTGKVQVTEADPEVIARQQLERLMGAQSFAGLFEGATAENVQDHLGEPIIVRGVTFNESDEAYADNGPGFYAVIDATINGEAHTLTTGAIAVMRFLWAAKAKGFLPADRAIVVTKSDRPTANGFLPLVVTLAP